MGSEQTVEAKEGDLLWRPTLAGKKRTRIAHYVEWLAAHGGPAVDLAKDDAYAELWRWSVTEVEAFWQSIWDYFEVISDGEVEQPLATRQMPGARWFAGAQINYVEHSLRRRDEHCAVIYRAEQGDTTRLSYAELADQVARARAGLVGLGVEKGDRVVAFMPNSVEALVAFLATASLGAIWSSASPEFGVKSVLDRFGQIEPKVLVAVDAYPYSGKLFERGDVLEEIRAGLPTLKHTVLIPRGKQTHAGVVTWAKLLESEAPLSFERVPFDHPLYILYSSGTTGLPKPIVHGHGGILLEHFKALSLHCDLSEEDRFFWFSTTGWMMWNFLVSGLLLGTTIVLFEGNPGYPDLSLLWRFAADEKISYFGTSAPFLIACKKQGLKPGSDFDLSSIRGLGSTGAPLPADGFGWVYQEVGSDLVLGSISGGTDVCTAFVGGCPIVPVRAGELMCSALGCKVESFDPSGKPVIGEVGELVITEPMPSMPVCFFGDDDGSRYHDSYFSVFERVWRHGDWIKITEHGSSVIYGRSDSTLNRGGVRMGTSEFYRIVDGFSEIKDSLVVDTGTLDNEGRLWLFVVLAEGKAFDEELTARLKKTLRLEISPRHVPDEIRSIGDVPRTISGKKLEVPIKRILAGMPVEKALNRGTLANPDAVDQVLAAAGYSARG